MKLFKIHAIHPFLPGIILTATLLFPFLPTQAQTATAAITGVIIDAESRKPIANANVFLDLTSKGDVSEKDGRFAIHSAAPGTYTLVAYKPGFRLSEKSIVITGEADVVHDFRLLSRPFQPRRFETIAEKDKSWQQSLAAFKRRLVGSSDRARQCTIINPQYLDFSGGSPGGLIANAAAPLEIENHALGYRIRFMADAVKFNGSEMVYSGKIQFVEGIPKNEAEGRSWKENREKAYMGSPQHFLRSLIRNEFQDEGFIVYTTTDGNISNTPVSPIELPVKVEPGQGSNQHTLSFAEPIKVEYRNGKSGEGGVNHLVSWIELRNTSAVVDTNGNPVNLLVLRLYGYWASRRLGDLLPKNYQPGSTPLPSLQSTPAIDALTRMMESDSYNEIKGDLVVDALDELVFKNSYHDDVIKRLHFDITDIMSEGDIVNWEQLDTNKQKAEFLRSFWLFRDKSIDTRRNERLEEHYERMRIARSVYSTLTSRGYDDRGEIYVRYGVPDAKQGDVMPLYKNMGGWVEGRSLETWSYQKYGRQITFNFVDKIWGYLLVRTIDDFFPHLASGSERRAILSEISFRRIDLDFRFGLIYAKTQIPGISLAEIENLANEVLREQSAEQTQIPKSISNQFDDLAALDFSFKPALFKNSNNRHLLSLAYGLRHDDLKWSKSDSGSQADIQYLAVIRDSDLIEVETYKEEIPIGSSQFDGHGEYVHQTQIPVGKTHFYILADVFNPGAKQKGFADYSVKIPVFEDDKLNLSSVIFAKDIVALESLDEPDSASVLIRNELAIRMYPFSGVRASEPIFLYFEIYGLRQGVSGKTDYEVSYTVEPVRKKGLVHLVSKLNPFKKDEGRISVSVSQQGVKPDDFVFTQLDFGQLSPGEQILTVRIKDKVANRTREETSEFILR